MKYNIYAKYSYDIFGKCNIIINVDNIANINPIRYRSYYYDNETNLYYLNTRYYDPDTMRFISLDSVEYKDYDTLGGLNLFVYCNNNPVMYVDPDGNDFWGNFWKVVGAVIGSGIGAVIGYFIGNIPGAIFIGLIGGALGVLLATFIETEIYVATSNVIADDTVYNGSETYSMTRDEALAYIRWLREKSEYAESYKKNWTEGQMLREWQYHKTGYNLFKWQNDEDRRTLAHHFKDAHFEEEQNFGSYILRILGNLLIGQSYG